MRTGNFQLVREINRRLLFNLIRAGGEISRARLVEVTALSKATVSVVVDELIERDLIVEGAVTTGAVGRRPILLKLNPHGPYLGAVQVQPGRVVGGLTGLYGGVVERVELPIPAGEGQSALRAIANVLGMVGALAGRTGRKILGAGISVPGILNPPQDVVLSAPGLDWRDVSLRRVLADTVRFPLWLGDDAKMAALAEATAGEGRGAEVLLYIGLGANVSAGLVRFGRLMGGTHVGHLTVVPGGTPCWCGNRGCLDTLLSEDALRRRYHALRMDARTPSVERIEPSAEWLAAQAAAGDKAAHAVVREAGVWLGLTVANLINLYQPELVLLGGWAAAAGAALLDAVGEEVRCRALPALVKPVRIALGSVGADAVLTGAAALALDGVLGSDPSY